MVEGRQKLRSARVSLYQNRRFVGMLANRFDLIPAGDSVEWVAGDTFGNLYFNPKAVVEAADSDALQEAVERVALHVATERESVVALPKGDTAVVNTGVDVPDAESVDGATSSVVEWSDVVETAHAPWDVAAELPRAADALRGDSDVSAINDMPLSAAGPRLAAMARLYGRGYADTVAVVEAASKLDAEYALYMLRLCKRRNERDFVNEMPQAIRKGDVEPSDFFDVLVISAQD